MGGPRELLSNVLTVFLQCFEIFDVISLVGEPVGVLGGPKGNPRNVLGGPWGVLRGPWGGLQGSAGLSLVARAAPGNISGHHL